MTKRLYLVTTGSRDRTPDAMAHVNAALPAGLRTADAVMPRVRLGGTERSFDGMPCEVRRFPHGCVAAANDNRC